MRSKQPSNIAKLLVEPAADADASGRFSISLDAGVNAQIFMAWDNRTADDVRETSADGTSVCRARSDPGDGLGIKKKHTHTHMLYKALDLHK